MNIILCNVGWLKYYQGCRHDDKSNYADEYEKPINGGDFNKEYIGLEEKNFCSFDGYCLGYVQLPGSIGSTLHPERYWNQISPRAEFIENVLVIWVATATKNTPMIQGRRIVGWYKNATLFMKRQDDEYHDRYYYFKAKTGDCICVPEDKRNFIIKHELRNFAYIRPTDGRIQSYLEYIEGYTKDITISVGSDNEREYVEGITKHRDYEYKTRNHAVVQEAKKRAKENNKGRLLCDVCGFDFFQFYGSLGSDFIEAHHNIPHSELGRREIDVSDFSLVCSNCHSMLHREKDITVDTLKKLLPARL